MSTRQNNGKGRGIGKISMEVRKMQKGLKKIGVGLVAVGLCLALLATACIPQAVNARPAEEPIYIGMTDDFTGPIAQSIMFCGLGVIDYARWLSEKEGGIDGHKIEVIWEDTRSLVPRTIIAFKRMVARGIVYHIDGTTITTETILPRAQREEIPIGIWGAVTPGEITKPMWVFNMLSGWGLGAVGAVKWFKDNWAEPRPLRAGLMTVDYSSGWDMVAGMEEYCPKLGVEFVGYEVCPMVPAAIDTSVEWLRLAAKNPDLIIMYAAGTTLVTLVKDPARLGIQEKGVTLCNIGTIEEKVLEVVGKSAEGWYVSCPATVFVSVERELPGAKRILAAAKEYRGWGPDTVPITYVYGWVVCQVGVEAIRIALAQVGYENLTGRAVREGFVSIRDFDVGGIAPPVTVSDRRPYFNDSSKMYEIQQGKIMPVGDWTKLPFLLEIE